MIVRGTSSGRFEDSIPDGHRRVLVNYKKGSNYARRSILSSNPRIKHVMDLNHLDISVIIGTDADIQELANNPDVEGIEEDAKYYPMNEQIPWGIMRTKSNFVWNKGFDGSGVKVCVIDSGIRLSHEDFDPSKITGEEGKDWFTDECGHGSHVAGTIAAIGNNNKGVVGVAPGASLHIVKVFAKSSCYWAYASSLMGAMQECVDANSSIISMSLGTKTFNQRYSDYIAELWQNGVLIVASAGNSGRANWYNYPASYDNVLSVAATTSDNYIADFSQVNERVDISAPGVAILSVGSHTDSQYTMKSGTSMSAPHISGIAALLWSAFPEASNALIKESLVQTAIDYGPAGKDWYYGYGLADANSAYDYLEMKMPPLQILHLEKEGNVFKRLKNGRTRLMYTFHIEANKRCDVEVCFGRSPSSKFQACRKSSTSNSKTHEISVTRGRKTSFYIVKIANAQERVASEPMPISFVI